MNRVSFFIDGFNLYHALDSNPAYHKYKWLDFDKLVRCYLTKKDELTDIFYFTAYITWDPPKLNRHKLFVQASRTRNVKIIFGKFKRRDKFCTLCKKTYSTFEEKQTDVNIAISLFKNAMENKFDRAIIVSGDSDLIPSIEAIKSTFPAKQIGVVIPIGRKSESLKNVCDFHMKMKEKHLISSLFPDEIDLGSGVKLIRPISWK